MKIRYDANTGLLGKAYPDNMIVPEPYISMSIKEYDDILNETDKIPLVKDGVVVFRDKELIDGIKKEIEVVEKQFEEATAEYTEAMNTPVQYVNGFTYFPRYAEETYQGLVVAEMIARGQGATTFPRLIKDSTKLAERAVSMTYEELLALTTFLATKQEQLWTIKANKESELLVRKEELEEQLKELLRIN